jgi:hypothetical protein
MKHILLLTIFLAIGAHSQTKGDSTFTVPYKAHYIADTTRVLLEFISENYVRADSALEVVSGYGGNEIKGTFLSTPQIRFYRLNGDPFDKSIIMLGVPQTIPQK